MREGWKCPVCGKGVSPDVKDCDHAGTIAQPLGPLYPIGPTWPNPYTPPWHPVGPSFTGDPIPLPYEITCGDLHGVGTA